MKKFLSVFMSIVMLLSITAGVNMTAYASGWLDNVQNVNLNTVYTESMSTTDYCTNYRDGYYIDSFKFTVPISGKVTFNFSTECKDYVWKYTGVQENRPTIMEVFSSDDLNNPICSQTMRNYFNNATGEYYDSCEMYLTKGTYYLTMNYKAWVYYYNGGAFYGYYNFSLNYNPTITKPANVKVSSSSYSGFTVNWSKVANVDGYLIKYATKSDFSNAAIAKVENGNTTSKTITGRASNTKYYVKMQAYKKVNGTTYKSNWSEIKTVKTLEKKVAITSITPMAKGFTVKWDKVNGKLGYQIRYATKSNFSNAAIIYAGNGSTTSKTVTGRAARTKYYVQVRSYVKVNGQYKYDAWSPAKTVTTK